VTSKKTPDGPASTRKSICRLAACIALFVMTGCISSSGPVAIEDSMPFPGLYNILNDLPAGGSLNIFVTHGMSTKQDESEPNLRQSIAKRLGLTLDGSTVQKNLPIPQPTVTLDGQSIWPAVSGYHWQCTNNDANFENCDAPYLDITTYKAPDQKSVVFYSLNYWGVLVWLKCSQLIPPDTRLTGDLTAFFEGNAAYCNKRFAGRPGFPMPTNAVSSSPVILDHIIKSVVMDWGFGDAVIAISGYREVLHKAVHEGLNAEGIDVGARLSAKAAGKTLSPAERISAGAEMFNTANSAEAQRTQAYAVITESLGSYVLLDALSWASVHNLQFDGESIVCRAGEIHMLANQVSLLRLSRVRVDPSPGAKAESGSPGRGSAPSAAVKCPGSPPPPYIVAYHDPSDILTFYVPHAPVGAPLSFETLLNARMINVVAPFATQVIPFVLAAPDEAHVKGQEVDPRIQDMVSFGSNGREPNKGPAADLGPAPGAERRLP
jgi:hypothetical protein